MREYVAAPCTDERAEHAEGPSWDSRSGSLLWVDIYNHAVLRGFPRFRDGGCLLDVVDRFDVGECVSVVVPVEDPEAGYAIATEIGVADLGLDGLVESIVVLEPSGRGRVRMNDGKCDPAGRLWVGTMAHAKTPGAGRLFRIDVDGSVHVVKSSVTISNGLTWSEDGLTMYYVDTPQQNVERMTLSRAGEVMSSTVAFSIPTSLGAPDGMTSDSEGCLWIAMWGAGQVLRFSPDGEVLTRVRVDAPLVSSCTFGGPNLMHLFVTTSQEGMSESERERWLHAGKVFALEVDVPGSVTHAKATLSLDSKGL